MVQLIDTLLDRSLVGGYSRAGYALRRHGWNAQLPRMDGQLAVVTGATSGIGLAAAAGFVALGARVVLAARDEGRGQDARRRLGADGERAATVMRCDLADLGDVRRFAAALLEREPRVDVLVNNAGVLTERRETSVDGHELTLATNVLGPFLLTALLGAAARRVVDVSSGGMYAQKLEVDDLQYERGDFDGTKAYARTKRAEVVLAELRAERDAGATLHHAMHPGWVDTPGLAASLPGFRRIARPLLRTPAQGADTIVWLGAHAADGPARTSGRFWHDRAPRPTHYVPWTRESAADRGRLWNACVALTGAP